MSPQPAVFEFRILPPIYLHWWFIVASLHEEGETGSIEVSKAADLIELDRNLFEVPPHDVHKVKVVLTLLEGKEVYRDPTFASPRTASGR